MPTDELALAYARYQATRQILGDDDLDTQEALRILRETQAQHTYSILETDTGTIGYFDGKPVLSVTKQNRKS